MSTITQSRGLRATVWLASTYICFLVASTAPWQQPSADQAPSVTSGVSLAAPPAPSVSGAGIRDGLSDNAPLSAEEVRTPAPPKPPVESAIETDRSARRAADRGRSVHEALKGIHTRVRIEISRQVLSEVERVAPVVAGAAADLALRHVAAAVRSIDNVRVKKAIAAAECAETRAAAKVMVAEIAADAIEHLVVRGVEAAVAHSVAHYFLFTVASINP